MNWDRFEGNCKQVGGKVKVQRNQPRQAHHLEHAARGFRQRTWPQVFIGGKLIGNADALEAYFAARKAA